MQTDAGERNLTSDEAIASMEAQDRWWAEWGERVEAATRKRGWAKAAFKDGYKAALLLSIPRSVDDQRSIAVLSDQLAVVDEEAKRLRGTLAKLADEARHALLSQDTAPQMLNAKWVLDTARDALGERTPA